MTSLNFRHSVTVARLWAMHNVKKGSLSEAKQAALRERAAKYTALSREALEARRDRRYDAPSLALGAQLLALNPEHATMWNWRKEACAALHPAPGPEREGALLLELELTQAGLMANPKSYCCWHHRRWAIEWGPLDSQIPRELKLCDKLLALDARNFHCWQYRRFLTERAALPRAQLLDFVDKQITADFSNYSAWHERTRLIDLGQTRAASSGPADATAGGGAPVDPSQLRAELELVRNAFYTAPEDSSAWFYHRWLLARAEAAVAGPDAAGAEVYALLQAELAMVRELLELEPGTKWPLLTGARVCLLLGGQAERKQARAWLAELSTSDPQRAAHYAQLDRQCSA
jgi:geranylgeranyl transferase type-2 subunit alpha